MITTMCLEKRSINIHRYRQLCPVVILVTTLTQILFKASGPMPVGRYDPILSCDICQAANTITNSRIQAMSLHSEYVLD